MPSGPLDGHSGQNCVASGQNWPEHDTTRARLGFKDHASVLVAAAERGEKIVITRHGKPAAGLSAFPADGAEGRQRAEIALERAARLRCQLATEGRSASVEEIIAWKNEGRP